MKVVTNTALAVSAIDRSPRSFTVDKENKAPQGTTADSFIGRARKEVGSGLIRAANTLELTVGGASGLAGATAGTYAGVVGGALVGTMFGAGLGPAVASLGSQGVLGFLSTAWNSTAVAAKVGMALGGATGLTGGWLVGKSIGSIPSGVVRSVGKKILGFDPDGDDKNHKGELVHLRGPLAWIGYGLGGAGLLTGVAGGAALGASVAGAADVASGLLAKGVSLSSVAGASLTGALIGGAALGVVGAAGGYALIRAVRKSISLGIDSVQKGQRWVELDEKENRLNTAQAALAQLGLALEANKEAAGANHEARREELDRREEALGRLEKRIQDKFEHKEELVDKRAGELYDEMKARLDRRESELGRRDAELRQFEKTVVDMEQHTDDYIERRQEELYNALKSELEASYRSRKAGLAKREKELDRKAASIPEIVKQKVAAQLKPLQDELANVESNTVQMRQRAQQLRQQADNDYTESALLRSRAEAVRSQADEARRKADDIRPRQNVLNHEVQSLRSRVESRKIALQRREAELERRGC